MVPNQRTLQCDGTLVSSLRIARGFSRATLAARTRERFLARMSKDQCSSSTVKRIEQGNDVLAGKVEAIAGALGAPIVRLLSRNCRDRLGQAAGGVFLEDVPPAIATTEPVSTPLAIRLECEARFRKILVDDHQLVIEGRMQAERYWRSYWYHQWDQFRYWRDGALDSSTFFAWMRFRRLEYRDNSSTGGIDYRTGWREFARWVNDPEFSRFMERVFLSEDRIGPGDGFDEPEGPRG